jgi:hypothetical protein
MSLVEQDQYAPVARLLRTLYATREKMDDNAPDGYTARVRIHVPGEEIEPYAAQLLPPWLFFEHDDEDGRRRVVGVRPEQILRVDVRFVSSTEREAPGFHIRAPEEEPLGA